MSFEEIVVYAAYLFLIPLILFTIYWIWKKEYLSAVMRNIAGFSVGLLDQTLMIIFRWQPTYYLIVVLFDYVLYGTWFLLMPSWKKINPKKWMPIWIIFSGIFNTILENIVRIYSYGGLNYPAGWTLIHTVIFYLCMHTIGTLIASSNVLLKKYKVFKRIRLNSN
ncbi:MAG: hypothetical protein ACTSRP_11645 [Candidatus Helarchaeota archaeon]